MAANIVLNPGVGGDTSRAEQKGIPKTGVFIIDIGGAGAEILLSAANPLPITGTISLPTGASTAALQSTGNLTLLDILNVLVGPVPVSVSGTVTVGAHNVTNTGTFAVQVSSLPALPAGTNNIGDVDVLTLPALPAGTNNIGDVDVLSIAAGDNNIGNVDIVTMPNVTIAGTVTVGSHAVTNAGTFVVQLNGAALTALELIDNVIYTEGATDAAIKGVPLLWEDTSNTLRVPSAVKPLPVGIVGTLEITAELPAGTQVIGSVGLAAGTALIGKTSAGLNSSEMYDADMPLTPKFATIDTATSGDVTVATPAAGKKIRVLGFNFIAVGTAVNVYLKTGSTAKFGSATRPFILDKTGATGPGGFNSGFCPVGWFEGIADDVLKINLSTTQGVIGNVVYLEV